MYRRSSRSNPNLAQISLDDILRANRSRRRNASRARTTTTRPSIQNSPVGSPAISSSGVSPGISPASTRSSSPISPPAFNLSGLPRPNETPRQRYIRNPQLRQNVPFHVMYNKRFYSLMDQARRHRLQDVEPKTERVQSYTRRETPHQNDKVPNEVNGYVNLTTNARYRRT